jgi:chromosome segregation ATPase
VAVLVAAGIIAITWSLSGPSGEQASLDRTIKETRAKLTAASDELKAVREAKASVDGTLAETQARLTTEQEKRLMAEKAVAAEQEKRLIAEKAVADVKAVLASIPSDASSKASSTPTEPTNEPSPK